jgi:uncharacterized phage protein (TIGR02218 family)
MSFSDLEASNQDAIPVSLYQFVIGTKTWEYASTDYPVDLQIGNATKRFLPLPISDSGMTASGDPTSDEFTITMPITDFVTLFQNNPPSLTCYVIVRRKNRGASDAKIYWFGEVRGVKRTNGVTVEVSASALSASFQRKGLRLSYSRGCPYALYDMCCKVDKNAFARQATVRDLGGTVFFLSQPRGEPEGYFNGGFFEWYRPEGIIERRMIEFLYSDIVGVMGTTDGLAEGTIVTLYPGCARTTQECEDKFNNLANYGGFPHMPGKSPFGSDPVF